MRFLWIFWNFVTKLGPWGRSSRSSFYPHPVPTEYDCMFTITYSLSTFLSVDFIECTFEHWSLSKKWLTEFKNVFWSWVDTAFFDPYDQANNRCSFDGNRLMQLRAMSEYPTSLVRNRCRFAVCNSDTRIVSLVINPYLHACFVFVHRPQGLTSK